MAVFALGLFAATLALRANAEAFVTWDTMEADKCASIWLIKRFISPDASISFVPKGQKISEGIPFDTPDAKFRRYQNKSTFQTFIDHYRISDPKLEYIARIIHDIEINIWERKVMKETPKVQEAMEKIGAIANGTETITACRDYFNRLYQQVLIQP